MYVVEVIFCVTLYPVVRKPFGLKSDHLVHVSSAHASYFMPTKIGDRPANARILPLVLGTIWKSNASLNYFGSVLSLKYWNPIAIYAASLVFRTWKFSSPVPSIIWALKPIDVCGSASSASFAPFLSGWWKSWMWCVVPSLLTSLATSCCSYPYL